MSEETLLERLLSRLDEMCRIPFENRLWDFVEIGEYLHRAPAVVAARIAVLPTFPKPVEIPSLNSSKTERNKKARPLYRAVEVVEWAEKHQK